MAWFFLCGSHFNYNFSFLWCYLVLICLLSINYVKNSHEFFTLERFCHTREKFANHEDRFSHDEAQYMYWDLWRTVIQTQTKLSLCNFNDDLLYQMMLEQSFCWQVSSCQVCVQPSGCFCGKWNATGRIWKEIFIYMYTYDRNRALFTHFLHYGNVSVFVL